MNLPVTPLHMGGLHPFEQLLVLLLAFGPFAVLAVVVVVRRRHDLPEEDEDDRLEPPGGTQRER